MSRLNDIADQLRRNASNITAPDQLDKMSEFWTLRKRPSWREHKQKVDEDGVPIRDHYLPHLPITATAWARTKKCFAEFRRQIKERLGKDFQYDCLIWEEYLLMFLEHGVREMKIDGDHIEVVTKLMLPLPKEEWLVNKRKQEKQSNG